MFVLRLISKIEKTRLKAGETIYNEKKWPGGHEGFCFISHVDKIKGELLYEWLYAILEYNKLEYKKEYEYIFIGEISDNNPMTYGCGSYSVHGENIYIHEIGLKKININQMKKIHFIKINKYKHSIIWKNIILCLNQYRHNRLQKTYYNGIYSRKSGWTIYYDIFQDNYQIKTTRCHIQIYGGKFAKIKIPVFMDPEGIYDEGIIEKITFKNNKIFYTINGVEYYDGQLVCRDNKKYRKF